MSNYFSYIKTNIKLGDVLKTYGRFMTDRKGYLSGDCIFCTAKDTLKATNKKGIYYCFECQATGDCIALIARKENLSQFDAAKHLAEEYGLDPHKPF